MPEKAPIRTARKCMKDGPVPMSPEVLDSALEKSAELLKSQAIKERGRGAPEIADLLLDLIPVIEAVRDSIGKIYASSK